MLTTQIKQPLDETKLQMHAAPGTAEPINDKLSRLLLQYVQPDREAA